MSDIEKLTDEHLEVLANVCENCRLALAEIDERRAQLKAYDAELAETQRHLSDLSKSMLSQFRTVDESAKRLRDGIEGEANEADWWKDS